MKSLLAELDDIAGRLATAASDAAAGESIVLAEDADLLALLQTVGTVQRRVDGLIVAAAATITDRDRRERSARLTAQAGCRGVGDLLQRTLRTDRRSARRYVAAAEHTHRELDITSGEMLPCPYPQLAESLRDGALSVSGFLACVEPMHAARLRIAPTDRETADGLLACAAAGRTYSALGDESSDDADGEGADGDEQAPAPTVEELAGLAAHILACIDPDGAAPDDRNGELKRFFTLGALRGGVVPVRGAVLPEVAGQLQRLMDAYGNPRVRFEPSTPDEVVDGASDGATDTLAGTDAPPLAAADLRSPAQKRHDALAAILTVAAASDGVPALGGAAPTLLVSVTADDFAHGTGRATIEGVGYRVPVTVAAHTACAGGVQRVLFDERGAIRGISTTARIFSPHQRRAIVLRDRECVIPGCDVPADWCEIHHVTEHAKGGPTETGNGVPLCWHHHRTIDTGGWAIRMRHGYPEVRGPGWWDPSRRWRSPRHAYAEADLVLSTSSPLANDPTRRTVFRMPA